MDVNAYFEHLEERLEDAAIKAVEVTAVRGEQMIRGRMPDYRVKTKQALRHYIRRQGNGYRITYGLRFSTKYKKFDRSHSSYRIFRDAWRESRADIRELFERELTGNMHFSQG